MSLPDVEPSPVSLDAEGLDVQSLAAAFGRSGQAGGDEGAGDVAGGGEGAGDAAGGDAVGEAASADGPTLSDVLERLDDIEARLDDAPASRESVPVSVASADGRTVLVLPEDVTVEDASDVTLYVDEG